MNIAIISQSFYLVLRPLIPLILVTVHSKNVCIPFFWRWSRSKLILNVILSYVRKDCQKFLVITVESKVIKVVCNRFNAYFWVFFNVFNRKYPLLTSKRVIKGKQLWFCLPLVSNCAFCLPLVSKNRNCLPLVSKNRNCLPLVSKNRNCLPEGKQKP